MDNKELLQLMKEAKEKGQSLEELLQERIAKDETLKSTMVKVQIMPNHYIAGFGSALDVVPMPAEKALDLSKYGKVNILTCKEDIISRDDAEAIQRHIDDGMDVRLSKEGKEGKRLHYARETYQELPEESFELDSGEEEMEEKSEKAVATISRGVKKGRLSRRVN